MHTEVLVVLDRLCEEARRITVGNSPIKIFLNGNCVGRRKEFATMGVRIGRAEKRFDSFLSRYSDAADDLILQLANASGKSLRHQCLYCKEEHEGLGRVSFPAHTIDMWVREINTLAQGAGELGSYSQLELREHGAPFNVSIESHGLVRCTIAIARPDGGERAFMSEAREIGDAVVSAHTKLFHASLSAEGHACPDCGRHHHCSM